MKKIIAPVILILLVMTVGCYLIITEYNAKQKAENEAAIEEEEKSKEEALSLEELKVETEAIYLGVKEEENLIGLREVETGKDFALKYNGGTGFFGKHGNSLTLSQIMVGEIVKAEYSTREGKLSRMSISDNAWTQTGITRFEIDEKAESFTIADEEVYKIDDNLVISHKDEMAEIIDITPVDELIVKGKDNKVLSVIVDKGHGYLRLSNDTYFVGGWIEVGQDIIKPVAEDMLFPVPVGKYHVRVTNKGYLGEEDIEITRDEETLMDLSKIEIEEVAIGHVMFNITPDFAQLFIDGEMTEFDDRVPLEYGIHKIHVEQAGYKDVDTSIKISGEYADVDIELELDTDDSDEQSQSSSSSIENTAPPQPNAASDNTGQNNTNNNAQNNTGQNNANSNNQNNTDSTNDVIIGQGKKIYIDSPVGAEVYLDGAYIGVAPANTTKVVGSHMITLAKSGYNTKTYTINVANDDKDVTFSFSDLSAQ